MKEKRKNNKEKNVERGSESIEKQRDHESHKETE